MPPSTFDPLSNPRTSQVLFLLIQRAHVVDTPKQLASTLGIKPPAVIEQLDRLRRIKVVTHGRRIGKEQHYAIDWDRLTELTIRRALRLPQLRFGKQGASNLAGRYLKYVKFRDFVRNWIEQSVRHSGSLLMRHALTFADVSEDLHITILGTMSNPKLAERLETLRKGDENLADVYAALASWRDLALMVPNVSEIAFQQALRKSGFKI